MGPILWRLWLRANAQHSTRIHTLTDVHCLQANASCTAPVHLYTYSYPPSSSWGLSRKTKSTHCVPQQAVTCVNKGLSCLEQRCVPSWTKACALLNKGLCPLEQRLVGPPEQRLVGPSEQRLVSPLEQRLLSPLEQRLGSPLERRHVSPLEQRLEPSWMCRIPLEVVEHSQLQA